MIGSAAMAAVYVAAGKADAYSENRNFSLGHCCRCSNRKAAGGKVIYKNLHSDYRVDAKFSNNQIEELYYQ